MCQNKFIEEFDNAHSLKRHKVRLSKCGNYIESLSIQGVSHDFYQQAIINDVIQVKNGVYLHKN